MTLIEINELARQLTISANAAFMWIEMESKYEAQFLYEALMREGFKAIYFPSKNVWEVRCWPAKRKD